MPTWPHRFELRGRRLPNAILALLTCAAPLEAQAPTPEHRSVRDRPWRIELEGGPSWQSRNDVAIPGNTGTPFSLLDLTGSGPFPLARITVEWDASKRHGWRFVYAPVRSEGTGALAQTTNFNGQTFAAGPASGAYQFDTYRLTWRYRFWETPAWTWRAGLTGLVRDASIEVSQGALSSKKSNTGFVPLLHVDGEWRFAERWSLEAVLDGAAAPQGRAFDFSLKAGYDLSDRWKLAAGYRAIEGGADNDEVYNFAWINAAVVSLTYAF